MKSDIVVVDTETTNLIGAMANDLKFQPYIIEIYIQRLNNKMSVIDEYLTLIKPPVSIPKFITRITRIDDHEVRNSPPFKQVAKPIINIMKGAGLFVAHNATFDYDMIANELTRANKNPRKALPKKLYCTVEQSMYLMGYRLRNLELYTMLTGKTEIPNQHRAKADVMATVENYKILTGRG